MSGTGQTLTLPFAFKAAWVLSRSAWSLLFSPIALVA